MVLGAALAVGGSGVALGAGGPAVRTDRGCYLIGQAVHIQGSGFAASRMFEVAIDGVDFGQDNTNPSGSFSASLIPGGLPAGVAQGVDRLEASDGTSTATTTFTLTRPAGARFFATSGLRARLQVWGFARDSKPRSVYTHYVSPSGAVRATVSLGRTGGQCGSLRTGYRPIFPFSASRGGWTLQIDTRHSYARRPSGPVTRIHVRVG
jgi:hypothetical protein